VAAKAIGKGEEILLPPERPPPGTDAIIFTLFSPKKMAKKWALLTIKQS
jgi:hypothetical protein